MANVKSDLERLRHNDQYGRSLKVVIETVLDDDFGPILYFSHGWIFKKKLVIMLNNFNNKKICNDHGAPVV